MIISIIYVIKRRILRNSLKYYYFKYREYLYIIKGSFKSYLWRFRKYMFYLCRIMKKRFSLRWGKCRNTTV